MQSYTFALDILLRFTARSTSTLDYQLSTLYPKLRFCTFKRKTQFTSYARTPQVPKNAHMGTITNDKKLTDLATRNIEDWYNDDIEF